MATKRQNRLSFARKDITACCGLITTENGSPQTISGTFVKINQFNQLAETIVHSSSSLADQSCTFLEKGIYEISLTLSFSGASATTYTVACFLNGVEREDSGFVRKLGGTDVGDASFQFFLRLDIDDTIDMRVKTDGVDKTFNVERAQWSCIRVGF